MDPARVAIINFSAKGTTFDEYKAEKERKICLYTGELLKLLKRARGGESVRLSLDDETGQLNVIVDGAYPRSFKMPTLEPAEEEVPLPNVTSNAKATLTTNGLSEAFRDAELAGDYVTIETDGEDLLMNAKGDLMGAKINIRKDSEPLLSLEVEKPSKSSFSLSHLTDVVKAAKATSDLVSIELSTDAPIRLAFKQVYEGKLEYYLAPRVEIE